MFQGFVVVFIHIDMVFTHIVVVCLAVFVNIVNRLLQTSVGFLLVNRRISIVVAIIRPVRLDGKVCYMVVEKQVRLKAFGVDFAEVADGLAV